MEYKFSEKVLSAHSKNISTFSMNEITDFQWDKAYLDYENYDKGEKIKEKYQLKGHIRMQLSNVQVRIIFAKNDRIVKMSIVDTMIVMFDPTIADLLPDTVLNVEWVKSPTHPWHDVLYLTIKE